MPLERAGGGTANGSPFPSGASGRTPLILVVEDDPDSRAIYRTILLACGYAVVDTADGTEGLRLAGECAPDIIVMDLGVPGIDGWSATRILTARADTATIPIVAVSGHVFPEHEARAWEAGCVAFLCKPIEPRTLVAEIRRILGSSPGHPALRV